MIADELRSLVLSATAGFILTGLVGARLDAEHGTVVAGTVVATVVVYLLWCRRFRTRVCPRCRGQREYTDGYGHQRPRNCRRCGGDGRERRFGAVLQGLQKLS